MAKKVKSVEVGRKGGKWRFKIALHAAATLAFGTLLGMGFYASKQYAQTHVLTPATPPKVVLVNPPAWMNDDLRQRMQQIATPVTPRSSLDHDEVREIAEILAAEPWVKRVNRVRRVYGQTPGDTLEVDCEFRAPVALVQDEGWFWMVDVEGVKLPERFAKNELARVAIGRGLEKIQLRIITGVHTPAPQAGERWVGKDLVAGIQLAKLFYDKPYLNDVAMIDVSNVDPEGAGAVGVKNEVLLHTKYNTQIRWGEPVQRGQFSVDVPVAQKLLTLETLFRDYGRIDAGRPWIEIRYDRVLYPKEMDTQNATAR